jgi:hypothetical protein
VFTAMGPWGCRALRRARTNLIAASRGREDADHRSDSSAPLLESHGTRAEGYGPQGGGPCHLLDRR